MDKTLEIKLAPEAKDLILRSGNAPDIYVNKGYAYKTTTTESFIAAMKRFGSQERSVLAAEGGKIKAIVDCTILDRPQDSIGLAWAHSAEAERWSQVLDKRLPQPIFVKFLERECRLVSSPVLESLLAQLKVLKISTQILGDYSMDDRNNYTFMYKIGDMEGTTRIPSLIQIEIPLLDKGRNETVDIEIEFFQPTNATEKPAFGLICPTWEDLLQSSIDYEVDKIRKELPGWLILDGSL